MVQNIKKGAKNGRQLLIGTTNVDYGMLRVWDLAQISNTLSTKKANDKIVKILLASSAILGLFPPVEIDKHLYVDGGATMQIVGGLESRDWAYQNKNTAIKASNFNKPIKVRIWIIVNQKLLSDPKVTESSWISLAGRSLSTLIRSSTLQSIQDSETFVNLINNCKEFDIQMRYVAIPQNFNIADSDQIFDAKTMRSLVELGIKMGKNPKSWRVKSLRPGAPFRID